MNAFGMTIGSAISIRLAGRREVRKTLRAGLAGLILSSLGLLMVVFSGVPTLPVLLVGLAGESDARPMAITMTCCALLTGLAYLGRTRRPQD